MSRANVIVRTVSRVTGRVRLWRVVDALVRSAMWCIPPALLIYVLNLIVDVPLPLLVLPVAAFVVTCAVLAGMGLSRVDRFEVAKIIDDQMGLRDRLTSALYFDALGVEGGLARAAVEDASAVAGGLDTRGLAVGSWPRHTIKVAAAAVLTVVVAVGPVNIADWFRSDETGTVEVATEEVKEKAPTPGPVVPVETVAAIEPTERKESLTTMTRLEAERPPERDPETMNLEMSEDLEDDMKTWRCPPRPRTSRRASPRRSASRWSRRGSHWDCAATSSAISRDSASTERRRDGGPGYPSARPTSQSRGHAMSDAAEQANTDARVKDFRDTFLKVSDEISKVIVGYKDVIDNVLTALMTRGNVLLEGVPGIGKTMLVRTLGEVLDLTFRRVQFTADLMPADIIGTNMIAQDELGSRTFRFEKGPVFTHLLLADEINRATPKTQAALLEAMEEHSITVAGVKYVLEEPFFVLATQNPIEMEGTYPLPQAELDKFIFKLDVGFPGLDELDEIIVRTTYEEMPPVDVVASGEEILRLRTLVREVPIAPHVEDYAARVILATSPKSEFATDRVTQYIKAGSSPRGLQGLILAGKVKALLDNRYCVSCEDIDEMARPTLRHRIQRNLEAEAEEISTDAIIADLLEKIPQTAQAV